MRKVLLTLTLLGMLVASGALAQEPVSVEVNVANDGEFPVLELHVSVQDQNKVPVAGLSAQDITIDVNGTARTVEQVQNVTTDELPISVVLVIDTSESMWGAPLDNTKAAAIKFLDHLTEGDEVAVVSFSSSVRISQPFTTDLELARQAISGLVSAGRTALYDASYAGADVAAQASNSRRFVVFLTDGNEYGHMSSNAPFAGMIHAVENGIQFYTIGLGWSVAESYLETMATQTGGRFYLHPDSQTLEELYDYLGSYLRTLYIIRFDSGLEPDGATSTITVTTPGGSGSTTVTAPDLYPQIAVEGLPEGELTAPVTITVSVDAPRGLGNAELMVNGEPVTLENIQTTENGYTAQYTLDPYAFEPGQAHTISLTASDSEGGERKTSSEFSVTALPPVITIGGLAEGALVDTAQVEVSVDVDQAQVDVGSVSYSIDGEEVEVDTEAPYSATIDTLAGGPGDHTLSVTVTAGDQTTTASVNYTVDPQLFVTPSPVPTNTPKPTKVSPTDTPEPDVTDTPEGAAVKATEAQPTDTPEATKAQPTDTPEPTKAQPTDTPEATKAQPTDTPKPTKAPPTDTRQAPTLKPTATSGMTDVALPSEGEGNDSNSILPYAGGLLLLLILLAAFLTRRKDYDQQA